MSDLLRCAWREVSRRKGRLAANVMGYALAVAAMIVVVSLSLFSRDAADAILHHLGTHFVTFTPCDCLADSPDAALESFEEGFVAAGAPTNMLPAALAKAAKGLPAVKDASPFLMYRIKSAADGQLFTIGGFDPRNTLAVAKNCCAARDIISGRFLRPGDKGAVVLEQSFAGPRKLTAGDKLKIGGIEFSVIGVVKPPIRPAKADVYMPITEARRVIAPRQKGKVSPEALARAVNMILVEVESSQAQDQALASVRKLYPGLITSTYACYKPARKVIGMNEKAMWALTAVVAIGATLLAMRTQLSSVIERRREIGILKAIGWTNGDVVRLILTETALQAVAGAALGCVLAAAVILLTPAAVLTGIRTSATIGLSAPVFLIAFALALVGGGVAGALPALSAARLNPAEAMRRV